MDTTVITSTSGDDIRMAIECLSVEPILSMDCEGIDLSRDGQISIIQLSTRERCFLFDVLGLDGKSEAIIALKPILESTSILKIIHDPKMDGDALFHIFDIRLTNVHDTQAWDSILKRATRNLNQTLLAYGCEENEARSGDVYRTNSSFWATRPLTTQMISWSSGDVTKLFQLFDAQRDMASPEQEILASERSEQQAIFLMDKICVAESIKPSMIGRFIGTGGSNLRDLMMRVPGTFFHSRGSFKSGSIAVYAPDEKSLAAVLNLLRPYQRG